MSAQQIRDAWKRIEDWYRVNCPELLEALNPGATKTELKALEAAIKQRLPEDLLTSLMIHNGQDPDSPGQFLLGQLTLPTCERIALEHNRGLGHGSEEPPEYNRFYPENAIIRRYFHEGWIPIACEDAGANFLAVDMSPGPAGTIGQVIDFGRDIHYPGVVASSWGEFLQSYADLLEILDFSKDPEAPLDAFYRLCEMNSLDSLVYWAKDGRWPILQFDASWRTSTVTALAKTINKSRDFSVMPILADALQDAGCECVAVLNHCRDHECRHAKGCWVLDMLLKGKVTKVRWCHDYGRGE